MNKRGFLAGCTAIAVFPTIARAANLLPASVTASNVGDQAHATALTSAINILSPTTGPGWSVILPAATGSGNVVEVINRSGYFIVIYPPSGAQINYFGADIAYAIYPTTYLRFVDTGTNQWDFVYNIAETFPVFATLTAHAGGGQAKATKLGYGSSVITTCATAGDSVLLPIALGAGEQVFITNHGAASCDIYPFLGGKINSLAANAFYTLPAGKAALFSDVGPPNQWDGGTLG